MLKGVIAKDRKRTKDKTLQIDLDLTYITPNILAMAFPASGVESIWRNSIQDVYRLLSTTHGVDNYQIWNLAERETNAAQLDFKVKWYPFPDHHPPPLPMLCKIVHSISGWLKLSMDNVAGVHCVGGKGRTGTIISSYLFYSEKFRTADAAIEYFGEKRSQKKLGVTQPSQRRYIKYFESLVIGSPINLQPIHLYSVTIGPLPIEKGLGLEVYDSPNYPEGTPLYKRYDLPQGPEGEIQFLLKMDICGDLYLRFMGRNVLGKRFPYFHIALHTYFLRDRELVFPKKDLDAMQRNNFPEEMNVTLIFDKPISRVPHKVLPGLQPYITKFDNHRSDRRAVPTPEPLGPNPLVHSTISMKKSVSSPNFRELKTISYFPPPSLQPITSLKPKPELRKAQTLYIPGSVLENLQDRPTLKRSVSDSKLYLSHHTSPMLSLSYSLENLHSQKQELSLSRTVEREVKSLRKENTDIKNPRKPSDEISRTEILSPKEIFSLTESNVYPTTPGDPPLEKEKKKKIFSRSITSPHSDRQTPEDEKKKNLKFSEKYPLKGNSSENFPEIPGKKGKSSEKIFRTKTSSEFISLNSSNNEGDLMSGSETTEKSTKKKNLHRVVTDYATWRKNPGGDSVRRKLRKGEEGGWGIPSLSTPGIVRNLKIPPAISEKKSPKKEVIIIPETPPIRKNWKILKK